MENRYQQEKENYLKTFGEVIRVKRKRSGISGDELGCALGVSRSTISRYEQGSVEIPASALPEISRVCRFPMADYAVAFDEDLSRRVVDDLQTHESFCSLQPSEQKKVKIAERDVEAVLKDIDCRSVIAGADSICRYSVNLAIPGSAQDNAVELMVEVLCREARERAFKERMMKYAEFLQKWKLDKDGGADRD